MNFIAEEETLDASNISLSWGPTDFRCNTQLVRSSSLSNLDLVNNNFLIEEFNSSHDDSSAEEITLPANCLDEITPFWFPTDFQHDPHLVRSSSLSNMNLVNDNLLIEEYDSSFYETTTEEISTTTCSDYDSCDSFDLGPQESGFPDEGQVDEPNTGASGQSNELETEDLNLLFDNPHLIVSSENWTLESS